MKVKAMTVPVEVEVTLNPITAIEGLEKEFGFYASGSFEEVKLDSNGCLIRCTEVREHYDVEECISGDPKVIRLYKALCELKAAYREYSARTDKN